MSRSIYMGTTPEGIVHRSLDFAGRSIDFATCRDERSRITCTATIESRTATGRTVDDLFDRLVTLMDAIEPLHAAARVVLRMECLEALHGDPLPPRPEHFATVTLAGGRPVLTVMTAGPMAGRRN